MSDTVKLIIEIPKPMYENVQNGTYCGTLYEELKNGIPLDDVKAEIDQSPDLNPDYPMDKTIHISKWNVMQILDNIGKGSEVKPNETIS